MSEIERLKISGDELRDAWPVLNAEDRVEGFRQLDAADAEEFFHQLSSRAQGTVLTGLPEAERRLWMRLLAPDDAADVLQEVEPEDRPVLMGLLDEPTRAEVSALLAYAEDDAGGLMSPRFARVRPEMTVEEAINYLRRQVRERPETLYYAYVLDSQQRLLGVVSFRDLFAAPPRSRVQETMTTDLVTVLDEMDQETVAREFARHDLMAIPVIDADGVMRGIVTADDIVDVVQEEATEDIQKLGGMEALDVPYLQTPFWELIRKRGGWLAFLFLGEMLTASAMAYYQGEIARAVVLALFLPLIVSSGGNSGSQAATLVIRAMALGEVRLRDWWRIVRREFASGVTLGLFLAAIGVVRVLAWQWINHSYGEHYVLLALTIGLSLLGVVLWGTLSGSMLPFAIRALGLDPASASAPFVATLVDVVGLIIYFTAARAVLTGTLL